MAEKGMGLRRRATIEGVLGRFVGQGGGALGPAGTCFCPKCHHEEPHLLGRPCFMVSCPNCGTRLMRKI